MKEREFARRKKRYRDLIIREGLNGAYITHPADVRYLCGFTGSNGMVILLKDRGYLLTDFRYREQSAAEVRGLRVVVYGESFEESLIRILGGRSGLRLGFDPVSIAYAEVLSLRRALRGVARIVPVRGSLTLLRTRKSRAEMEIIRKAIRLAEASFLDALNALDRNTRESDFALMLDTSSRKRGAEDRAFETIVASGTRGAMVHARTSVRRITGAAVVDWGVSYRGYCTDMTRTLAFGRTPSSLRKAHGVVLEAQEKALESIRPGVKARDVDRAARDIIESAGYGACFGHSLGHGVGLEVHERPHIGRGSRDVIEEGMVFTIEPGIYIPGEGGVRVEDMVLVGRGGPELLTSLPRSLDPADY